MTYLVNVPKRVKVIGGCHENAIGKIGRVIYYDRDNREYKSTIRETFCLEFDDVVFEGADPKTQHPNRAYFFGSELELVKDESD